jgi:DNA-directed RNA polymerase alpha subunit
MNFPVDHRSSIALREVAPVQRTEDQMLRMPNFNRKALKEINEELAQFGLKIGMTLPSSIKDFDQL